MAVHPMRDYLEASHAGEAAQSFVDRFCGAAALNAADRDEIGCSSAFSVNLGQMDKEISDIPLIQTDEYAMNIPLPGI
eukprot:scaffold13_cov241-Pinguiococcus_pyrenoidosus.AAC.13